MKKSILHMLDPTPNNSPFDINMALDAGFDVLMPYSNVKLENVHRLTQDTIFSRSPAGVKKTAIFIGGRDVGLAMDMLKTCRQAMVPPFEISVFADPSGSFTTAAALVACVEKVLKQQHSLALSDCKAVVFGGTGPVGVVTGVIASLAGANTTLVDHLSAVVAEDIAKQYNRGLGCSLKGTVANFELDKINLIAEADIVFCTAKAGIQVLNAEILKHGKHLKVLADVNAVPPAGIEGIKQKDFGAPLVHGAKDSTALGVGALAVGDVKYRLQQELLSSLLEADKPVYLDFRNAFEKARELA